MFSPRLITTGDTTFEELSSRIDTKLKQNLEEYRSEQKQNLEEYRSELQPIKHAVQEHLSATVPASRMPEDKLRDLREAVHAAVVPVLDADDLEELLGPTPAQTDAVFDW
jgi:TRAP-type C4-dicarboxylate transport system substrate-binding protein